MVITRIDSIAFCGLVITPITHKRFHDLQMLLTDFVNYNTLREIYVLLRALYQLQPLCKFSILVRLLSSFSRLHSHVLLICDWPFR